MAKVAHLGPLAAILVNILQDLSMSSISKNVPLDELFQLSQSWGGGSCHGQTDHRIDRRHHRVTCRVAPCEQQGATKKQNREGNFCFGVLKDSHRTAFHSNLPSSFELVGQHGIMQYQGIRGHSRIRS